MSRAPLYPSWALRGAFTGSTEAALLRSATRLWETETPRRNFIDHLTWQDLQTTVIIALYDPDHGPDGGFTAAMHRVAWRLTASLRATVQEMMP